MKWSDPFTGWFDGWIGRWDYAAWVCVFLGVTFACTLGTLLWEARTGTAHPHVHRVTHAVLSVFWLNLDAKRWRDAGLNGWRTALLFMVGVWLVQRFAILPPIASFAIYLVPSVPYSDSFGHRVEREPVADPEVFN